MDTNKNTEYISEMIRHLEDQQKHQIYYISFNVGIIVLTLNGILFKSETVILDNHMKLVLIISLSLFLASIFFLSEWMRKLHLLRISATDLLFKNDIETIRKIHYPGNEYSKKHGWIYGVGKVCQYIGLLGYTYFLILLIY